MENTASNSLKLPALMSLDTTGVADYCDQLREVEHQQWRAQCDEVRARKEERVIAVTAHFGGVRGRGEGGEGSHGGEGRGDSALVPVPDQGMVIYRDEGIDDLVSVVLKCICYYFRHFSLTALTIRP